MPMRVQNRTGIEESHSIYFDNETAINRLSLDMGVTYLLYDVRLVSRFCLNKYKTGHTLAVLDSEIWS